jgi:sporulation protein YlmC with PRC-barrel domain
MTARNPIDLALGVLDHQLLDVDDRRCGKVDDLELEGLSEGKPRVAAIVTGPPAWRGRGRLGRIAATLARGRSARIPWDEVKEIGSAVHLRKSATEFRLGRGDERARPWVNRLPGSG